MEVHHGDKMFSKQVHAKMCDKYMSWTKIICDEDACGLKINDKPYYLSEAWFLTSDAKHTKPYVRGSVTGKKFWKKWGTVKCAIINSDNHVAKSTIASMPGGALPSGTNWSLFLTRLIYNLYAEKEEVKRAKKKRRTRWTRMRRTGLQSIARWQKRRIGPYSPHHPHRVPSRWC